MTWIVADFNLSALFKKGLVDDLIEISQIFKTAAL